VTEEALALRVLNAQALLRHIAAVPACITRRSLSGEALFLPRD
jgi:hypothetical protein